MSSLATEHVFRQQQVNKISGTKRVAVKALDLSTSVFFTKSNPESNGQGPGTQHNSEQLIAQHSSPTHRLRSRGVFLVNYYQLKSQCFQISFANPRVNARIPRSTISNSRVHDIRKQNRNKSQKLQTTPGNVFHINATTVF